MSLLLPAKKRDSADLTIRSANQRPRIFWEYLEQHKLVEKAMQSPFASLFYMVKNKAIPHLLVHQLLLREVDTSLPDELHVLLGSTICHFGRREFGLITGLKLDGDDIPADFEKQIGSESFEHRVFQGLPKVKVDVIFNALFGDHSEDDLWRLCLCYLIEGLVYGRDDSNEVWRGMLFLVEDLEKFFAYPWGQRIFDVTMASIRTANVPGLYLKKRKKNRPKYTIHGAVHILCYWALEVVPLLSTMDFVTRTTFSGFPRLQRWKIKSSPKFKDLSTIFDKKRLDCRERLVPCDKEEEDYVGLYHLDVPIVSIHDTPRGHGDRRRTIARDVELSHEDSDTESNTSKRHDGRGRQYAHDVCPSHSSYARLEDRVSHCEKTQTRLDLCMVELKRMMEECIQKTDESMRMAVEAMKKHDESLQLVRETHSMFQHLNNATTTGAHVGIHGNVVQPLYHFSAHRGTTGVGHQDSQLPDSGHRSEYAFQTSDPISNEAQLYYSGTTRPTHIPPMEHNFFTPIDGRAPQVSEYMQAMACLMNTTENAGHIPHPVSPLPFNLGVSDPTPDPIGEYIHMPSDDDLMDVPHYPKREDMPIPPHPDKLDIMEYVFNVVEEREHRLAKKDKWLDDYTDPRLKRPPLRYEVFRRLDFEKYESLYNWFKVANEQKTGKVVDDDGVEEGWGFFAVLLKRFAWLHWTHIDAGLRLYRERMKEHPSAYCPNTIICKSYFLALFLRSASERHKKDHRWSLSLIRAIKGVGGLCKMPWTATSEILTIWNVQRMHWVTVCISIPEWCISVYDSSFHALDEDETMKNLKEMCVSLPLVMHASGSFDEALVMKQDPIPSFKLNRVKDVNIVPQSDTSGDCGIYALKYVEHLITLGNNFENIIDKNMPYFRLRLAMDIFHQNKLP